MQRSLILTFLLIVHFPPKQLEQFRHSLHFTNSNFGEHNKWMLVLKIIFVQMKVEEMKKQNQ